jgi:hypothetical protein
MADSDGITVQLMLQAVEETLAEQRQQPTPISPHLNSSVG